MRIETPDFARNYPNLNEAVKLANQMLQGDHGFFDEIRKINAFEYSKNYSTHQPVSGNDIAPLLAQKIDITVKKYKPWYFWSKAIASTIPGVPVIRLNQYKLDRPIDETAATLIHECVHIVDTQKKLSFGHGNNYAAGKGLSAPYLIEKIAQEIITKIT